MKNLKKMKEHPDYDTYVILKDEMIIGYAGIVRGLAYFSLHDCKTYTILLTV